MSNKSRFRLEHLDGKTKIIDLSTGEDITSICTEVIFKQDSPVDACLVITLTDRLPEVVVEGAREIRKRS